MIVGITGGIGSGKSTIAKQLHKMGYSVYDTDREAKRLIVEDADVRQQIEQLLGKEVYVGDVYQTALVAQRVFADKSLLHQLNKIVHPAVRTDIRYRVEGMDKKDLFFVECAILYQAGIDQVCDKVIVVAAPEDVRLQRVIARDTSTPDQVRARMRAQDVAQDMQRADIVVNNDGKVTIEELCQEIITKIY
jgi:dephospho-CoA kinase